MKASETAHRRADQLERDQNNLERLGVRAAISLGKKMRIGAIRAWLTGRDPRRVVREFAENELAELLIRGMTVSHFAGRFRVMLSAKRHAPEEFAFGPYDDALKFIRERSGISQEVILNTGEKYAAEVRKVTRGFSDHLERKVQTAMMEVVRQGLHVKSGVSLIRAAFQQAGVEMLDKNKTAKAIAEATNLRWMPHEKPYLMETLFRTQTRIAYSAGAWNAHQDPAIQEILWGYEYVTMGDDRVRANHAALEGMKAPKDDPIWHTHMPPGGFSCLVPETLVSGQILNASRMRYKGPVLQIQTRNGRRLTVTTNHRIATVKGFLPAHELCQGDNLLSDARQINDTVCGAFYNSFATPAVFTFGKNNYDVPATIAQIFNTFRSNGTASIIPDPLALDFHGDAQWSKGQIDVVWPYCVLPMDKARFDDPFEQEGEIGLEGGSHSAPFAGHAFCTVNALSHHNFSPTARNPSRTALPFADTLVVGPLLPKQPFDPFRFGSSSDLDVALSEPAGNDVAADRIALGKLFDRFPSRITTDQITNVRTIDFDGHVYDLQTSTGYIIAQGIIISNCRCAAIEIFNDDEAAMRRREVPEGTVEVDGVEVVPGPDKGWAFNPGELYSDAVTQAA